MCKWDSWFDDSGLLSFSYIKAFSELQVQVEQKSPKLGWKVKLLMLQMGSTLLQTLQFLVKVKLSRPSQPRNIPAIVLAAHALSASNHQAGRAQSTSKPAPAMSV